MAAGRRQAGGTSEDRPARLEFELLQQVLSVSNEVAAELATVDDGILGALRERMGCAIRLRGNQLTLEGDDGKVDEARLVIDELVELVEGGHAIGPSTVDAVLAALDAAKDPREIFEDVVWRHRGKKITPKTVNQKHYVDAIRSGRSPSGSVRRAPGKTYLAMALASPRSPTRTSTASSSRALPWRPASGSASCPATCSRSTRTCARCSTRSTTCSTPTA